MDSTQLVRMANRIGHFFIAMPDAAEAQQGIADHIKRFWEPRMRKQLLAHLDAQQGDGLDAFVLAAVQGHRALLE